MSVKGSCLQSFHDLELILCSQLTANLLERFQGLRYCGSGQAFPARVARDYSLIFVCRLLCIPPFWSSFMPVVSVVPQRLTVAASGILALQIRFPSPFPTYIYTYSRSVAFPALTPTPSCCHFIFGWCWGKIIKCAWLNRSHGTGPFGGHLLRGCQCLLRHQLLSCSDSFLLCNPWMQFTETILFHRH